MDGEQWEVGHGGGGKTVFHASGPLPTKLLCLGCGEILKPERERLDESMPAVDPPDKPPRRE